MRFWSREEIFFNSLTSNTSYDKVFSSLEERIDLEGAGKKLHFMLNLPFYVTDFFQVKGGFKKIIFWKKTP